MASTKLKNKTTLFHKPLNHPAPSKIVRISFTDHDATDTSDEEEDNSIDQHDLKNHQRRLNRRIVNEVRIEASKDLLHDNNSNKYYYDHQMQQTLNEKKKYRGVRNRAWGKFAAEIRNPLKKTREWIGTFDTAEEAALAYDRLAIMYRGPKALTNIIPPPLGTTHHNPSSSDVIFGEFDECVNRRRSSDVDDVRCSPTSVLSSSESDFKVRDESEMVGYFDEGSASETSVMFGFDESSLWEETSCCFVAPENVFTGDISLDSVGDFRSCKWDVEDFFQDQCVGGF